MKTFKQHLNEKCWPGYKKKGTKLLFGKRYPNCVKEEEKLEEKGPGLWANIRAKRARGERMRKPGEKGAPTEAQLKSARNEEVEVGDTFGEEVKQLDEYESKGGVYKHSSTREYEANKPTPMHKGGPSPTPHDPGEKLSSSETNRTERAFNVHWGRKSLHAAQSKKALMNVHKDLPEQYEADDGPLTEEQIEALREGSAVWTRKEGQSESGGLNRKGIESYRRANPGSKLSMAVTTKPSKLKPGSKAANRRKSFCARMGGMKRRLTSAKTARDPDSRINKALRKWNC